MSAYYVKNPNEEGAANLFYKRTMYNNDSKMEDYGNLTDFNFAEKQLYGRVTPNFVPMEANFKRYSMKKFPQGQAIEKGASAVDFVVDAFNGLSQQFSKCAITQKIDTKDPYLLILARRREPLGEEIKNYAQELIYLLKRDIKHQ